MKERNQRIEKELIGGTEYIVIAEEMSDARAAMFDVIGGLVKRHFEDEQIRNLLFAE